MRLYELFPSTSQVTFPREAQLDCVTTFTVYKRSREYVTNTLVELGTVLDTLCILTHQSANIQITAPINFRSYTVQSNDVSMLLVLYE